VPNDLLLGGWCGKRVRIGYMGVCWSNFHASAWHSKSIGEVVHRPLFVHFVRILGKCRGHPELALLVAVGQGQRVGNIQVGHRDGQQ
jgi:hypothetical protein